MMVSMMVVMLLLMMVVQEAAEMLKLLLDHRADTTLLCNGHSPLSLAIVSGNDKVSHSLYFDRRYLPVSIYR